MGRIRNISALLVGINANKAHQQSCDPPFRCGALWEYGFCEQTFSANGRSIGPAFGIDKSCLLLEEFQIELYRSLDLRYRQRNPAASKVALLCHSISSTVGLGVSASNRSPNPLASCR